MQVRDGMSTVVLTMGPQHTLREAARLMSQRKVGAAVVIDPDSPGPGIITERDLMESIGKRSGPRHRAGRNHLTVPPRLRRARLVAGGGCGRDGPRQFRHLVVTEGGDIAGVLSVRDVVRCWTDDGAICDVPAVRRPPADLLDDPERRCLLLGLVAGGVGRRRGDAVAALASFFLPIRPLNATLLAPDLPERLSVPLAL